MGHHRDVGADPNDIASRLDTLAASLATMEIDATAEHRPSETIAPPVRRPSLLDALLQKLESDVDERFSVERTLGEVDDTHAALAEQIALGRKVAIKTLREEVKGNGPVQKVLQEAWITGYLEHPNVVPVYDIARGEDGRPVIVLKRIEGDSFEALLASPERLKSKHAVEDPFEWALRVTIQVCQALAHAHQRGILHRDIKAENVMVGAHGEVYLLDWGIAVAMEDDGTGRFPLASEATAVAGTPCYMAPEMLGGEKPNLGPWTDVYLVGSLLYEICTGKAPHDGATLLEIMQHVLRSPPPIPDDVPDEMQAILRRALDADPEARFENIDQLRLAIEGFLRHRGSRQLAERADEAAQEMDDAFARDDGDAAEVAFAEARFGYRAALELWAENPEAKARLKEATETMLRAALERGDPETAGRILATADGIDPRLEQEVSHARRAAAKKQAELAALEEDLDEDRGRRTRAFLALILCGIWVSVPFLAPYFGDASQNPRNLVLFTFGMIAFTGGLFFWARESMMATRINRTIAGGLLATMTAQLLVTLVGWHFDMSGGTVRVFWLVLFMLSVLWAMASVTTVLWPAAIAYGLAAGVAAVHPTWVNEALGVANGILLVNLLAANRALGIVRDGLERRREQRSERAPPE
jgi:hypothetical protein